MTARDLFQFRRWTLGAKLAATFAVVVSLVVLVVSLFVVSRSRSALEHELRDRAAETVHNLARSSADLVLEEDLWGLYKVVRDIARGGGDGGGLLAYAAVIDPAGLVLAHSNPEAFPMGEPFPDDTGTAPKAYRHGVTWSTGRGEDDRVHHFATPVTVDDQQVALARIGISLRQLEASLSRINFEIAAIGVLLQLLGAFLGYVIACRMTRPLTQLRLAVERIAAGRLDVAPAVSTTEKDEIGALADRFNFMGRRLRDSQRDAVEAQARLIRSERLASVGECAGSLAHEIRNPLGAVVAAARMLSSSAPQAAAYDRERLAAVIADEARRLSRILSDFLRFARPQPLALRPHSLGSLVNEVLELLRLDDLAANRTLEVEAGPERPCGMDRDQMKQALWNLLRNALEATPPGGRVVVRTLLQDDEMAVEISDQGPGISPERQARLFEPFQTSKKGGSGLGLAIAHRIVSDHGGSIGVSSGSGGGTCVRVALPLRPSAPRGEDEAA